MAPVFVISFITGIICLLLLMGAPSKILRFIGQGLTKVMIGALMLFFVNVFGTAFELHIPINFVTAAVSGLLGIPGIAALIAIKFIVL